MKESALRFTIVRPPRLVDGPRRPYAVADKRLPPGRGVVSREDVAHFLLAALERDTHVRKVVGMAGAA